MDELTLSIGLGLAISILFSETFGIAAGGMIVPGYLAMHLNHPYNLLLTAISALITYGIVRSLSMFMIIFGRRRTVLMILVGYIVGAVATTISPTPPNGDTIQVIGYIIPGLIAIWLDRQGIIETFSSAATAAILVKLIIITLTGFEVLS